MPSSLLRVLAALLVSSSAAKAADLSATSQHLDALSRSSVEEFTASVDFAGPHDPGAGPAPGAAFVGPGQPDRESTMPSLKVRLGRSSALGRSPGAAPPAYGEVGIAVAPVPGLSLVPSYKVVLGDDPAGGSGTISGQVLKLGARILF